ncbi:MAG: MurR/RpiR family transcriptional regulator [Bacillota bacterium]|nr:MurR/RpiR family transcriptional regulator [Bacillota bacterium]
MIIEKLKEQKNFTDAEINIANYLMKNGFEIKNMSISDLAKATFSSPASITRLCYKLDAKGYKEFRIRFNQEYENYTKEGNIDVNKPFQKEDSFEKIAKNLQKMRNDTIGRIASGYNYPSLNRIVHRLHEADMINIIAVGTSVYIALDFQLKMLHYGKVVNVTQNTSFLPGYCFLSTKKSVNFIISKSGETKEIVECLKILKSRNQYCVAITSNSYNTVARMSNEIIDVHTEEDNSYYEKIDSFAAYDGFHYVLDCLYAFLVRLDYDKNVERLKENAYTINKNKK